MAPATQLPGRAERTPLSTRLFVVLFLAAFTVCGAAGIEAWPFTGWRLFSNVRTDEQAAWRAVAVDGGGREEQIRFAELPRGYRNFVLVMNAYPSLPEAERDAICRTWADALRRRGDDVAGIRIYRIRWKLSQRRFGGADPTRSLRYTCGRGT